MKLCPKCKKPLKGDRTVYYDDGYAGVPKWYCANCEHEWEQLGEIAEHKKVKK